MSKPARELTTDLPPPPAPGLGPTVVVVDNPEARGGAWIVRLIIAGASLPFPVQVLRTWELREPMGTALLLATWIGALALIFRFFKPERIRAGSDWLSTDGGKHWISLDSLERIVRARSYLYLTDGSRRKASVLSSTLEECPILFDLLMQATLKSEQEGRFKGEIGSSLLKTNAPRSWRGYRRRKRRRRKS